jgi:hypothetical protein
MEKRVLGWTTFSQSFHRGYCKLCSETGKTATLVASNAVLDETEKKTIQHMETKHGIRAAAFCGTIYDSISDLQKINS